MKQTSSGFTLIEVLISIAILATLTVLVAKNIQQALKSKEKIQFQIDDLSRIRDSLRLMERDINLAYHYNDIEKEMKDLYKKKNAASQKANQNQNNQNSGNNFNPTDNNTQNNEEEKPEAPRQDPVTHFVGTTDSMNFVTMNNGRMMADAKQADFVEVGYSLKDCKSLNQQSSSKCIWRRSSPIADTDVTKGGLELVLLENVSEFKLRYIGKGKQDWVTDWRSDTGGDASTKNNFPDAVEISLTIEKGEENKKKKYSMQIVSPIHFTNNKNPEDNQGTNEAGQNGQNTQNNNSQNPGN